MSSRVELATIRYRSYVSQSTAVYTSAPQREAVSPRPGTPRRSAETDKSDWTLAETHPRSEQNHYSRVRRRCVPQGRAVHGRNPGPTSTERNGAVGATRASRGAKRPRDDPADEGIVDLLACKPPAVEDGPGNVGSELGDVERRVEFAAFLRPC